MNIETAKKLMNEANELSFKLSQIYLSIAIPMARGGAQVDSKESARLYRVSEKATARYWRRHEAHDDLRWPQRVAQRAAMAARAAKKNSKRR